MKLGKYLNLWKFQKDAEVLLCEARQINCYCFTVFKNYFFINKDLFYHSKYGHSINVTVSFMRHLKVEIFKTFTKNKKHKYYIHTYNIY